VEKIQQRLDILLQKRLELERAQQNKFILNRWLGQADPELQAVNYEIAQLERREAIAQLERREAQLERRELEYLKVLQNAASVPLPVPEKDWTKYPLYSHTLRSFNFDYPVDQMGFYLTTLTGIGIISKSIWRSWNMKKAVEMLEKGNHHSVEPGKFDFHMHNSGFQSETSLIRAKSSRRYMIGRAFAVAGLMISSFTAFVHLKNKNRFNK
jgi:hypothetical protein